MGMTLCTTAELTRSYFLPFALQDRKKAGYGPSKVDGSAQRQGAGRGTSFDESAFEPARGTTKKKRKAPKKKSDKGFGN